jgi:hypothetical protein
MSPSVAGPRSRMDSLLGCDDSHTTTARALEAVPNAFSVFGARVGFTLCRNEIVWAQLAEFNDIDLRSSNVRAMLWPTLV